MTTTIEKRGYDDAGISIVQRRQNMMMTLRQEALKWDDARTGS